VLKEAFEGRYTDSTPQKQAKVSDIADVGTGATPLTSNPAYYGGKIAWVTSSKINDEKIYVPSEYITEKAIQETNCKVYPSHTLLIAMYGEGKTRGKCAELMISAATNQALAAIELHQNTECFRNYLRWFFVLNYQLIRRKASGGVQPNLNLGIIKNISVPIFQEEDQIKIVEEIESRLSVCDSIEKTVDSVLQQADAMRQNILKKAFEGEL
jgi:type I restriction enzyme S subunit